MQIRRGERLFALTMWRTVPHPQPLPASEEGALAEAKSGEGFLNFG